MKSKLKFVRAILFLVITCPLWIIAYWGSSSFQSHWEVINQGKTPDSFSILSLHFFDSNNGLVISTFDLYKTTDGGKNLESVFEEDFSTFNSYFFNKEKSSWIVGSNKEKPLILKSEDKNFHWQKANFDARDEKRLNEKFSTFYDICSDQSGKIWVVGDGGIIEATANGQDLNLLNLLDANETLYSVSCNNNGEIWGVGKKGTIFHYQNGWTKYKLNEKYIFTKIKLINENIWVLGGIDNQGAALVSKDGGQSWNNRTPERADMLFDLYIQEEKGWLVGANGRIFYTNDNGESWLESFSPTQNDLGKIFALDSENIWISGSRATILKLNK